MNSVDLKRKEWLWFCSVKKDMELDEILINQSIDRSIIQSIDQSIDRTIDWLKMAAGVQTVRFSRVSPLYVPHRDKTKKYTKF